METVADASRLLTPLPQRKLTSSFFRSVCQQDVAMVELNRMTRLPIFYYDNTTMTVIFHASTAKVKPLLPHEAMRPAEIFPGRCLVAFTAFEYRDTDIDPYNEFSISFLLSWNKRSIPGVTAGLNLMNRSFETYVWQLPVTTEVARWGGVELYGFPKFIGDIEFDRDARSLGCTLRHDGRHVLSLRSKALPTGPAKDLRFRTYSLKNGIPLCANIYLHPLEFAQSPSPDASELTLGDHPIADTLRTIDLSRKPVVTQYIPRNELILFGPRNLMDD